MLKYLSQSYSQHLLQYRVYISLRTSGLQVWVYFRMPEVYYISYNKGTNVLPDIYTLTLGCCMPSGIMCIYQAKHYCLCYNLCISLGMLVS